jgi:hypothetical protein
MNFFIHFVYRKKQLGKGLRTLDLSVEGRILTSKSHFFPLKLMCEKDIYNINHCVGTIKEI